MADKKNLCAQIDTALHARVRQEQEQSGQTLSEFVEQLITDYYKMKEGTKMTGDMRTMAIQLPEELFERLKAYLKKNGIGHKPVIPLQFSKSGSPEIERSYATYFVDLARVQEVKAAQPQTEE